ncbi:hypothetical protein [Mycobacteroides abscessus]|uniref:hypothetical protein n=1 Tax=Mycobacteroides abscessus TaxID=36809 RepID=UPI0009A75B62|nr:hypothetical protein [Mycobacteroides abscessus]SKO40265.1 Uncharacterised protein [Mycobacteroides abscessus subsp. abscessus]
MTTTITREGWTVTASIYPARIHIQHESWDSTEFEVISPASVAHSMDAAERALDAGAGFGRGTYGIPREDVAVVLGMLEEVLPEWLRAVPTEEWRAMPRPHLVQCHFLFERYGVPTEPLHAQMGGVCIDS